MADWQLAYQISLMGAGFLLVYIANSIKTEGGEFLPTIFKSILYIGAFGLVLNSVGSLQQMLSASSISNAILNDIAEDATVLMTGLFYFLIVSIFIISLFYYIKIAVTNKKNKSQRDYEKY